MSHMSHIPIYGIPTRRRHDTALQLADVSWMVIYCVPSVLCVLCTVCCTSISVRYAHLIIQWTAVCACACCCCHACSYWIFDELTAKNGVYKVETIGDAFMCVAVSTSVLQVYCKCTGSCTASDTHPTRAAVSSPCADSINTQHRPDKPANDNNDIILYELCRWPMMAPMLRKACLMGWLPAAAAGLPGGGGPGARR